MAILENIEKGVQTVSDDQKEKEISIVSFLLGFIIAYLFNANLISIFLHPDDLGLGWSDQFILKDQFVLNEKFPGFDPTHVFGFLVTGFFLSFGSKFFHDLLDTLLQTKELKRKLNDKETFNVSTIKEFDAQLSLIEKDMVRSVYEKNAAGIMKLDGVKGLSCASFIKDSKKVYGFRIYTSKPEAIASLAFTYDMPNGNSRPIPIQVLQQDDMAKACAMFNPSDNACNQTISGIGSLCFAVKDKSDPTEKFILTCYHVVKGPHHSWNYFVNLLNSEDKVTLQQSEKAIIYRGLRNNEMDAALIRPSTPWTFQNLIPSFQTKITSTRPVYYADDDQTQVNVYGSYTKKKMSGTITGVGAMHKIDYGEAEPFEMYNLIELQHNNATIVHQGDSGSLVFTDNGEALAMIVATSSQMALAIPLYKILNHWNLELDT